MGKFPIGSRIFESPLLFNLLSLKSAANPFAYSRPMDASVYMSPPIALNRNVSMIHIVITSHLLPGWCSFDSYNWRPPLINMVEVYRGTVSRPLQWC